VIAQVLGDVTAVVGDALSALSCQSRPDPACRELRIFSNRRPTSARHRQQLRPAISPRHVAVVSDLEGWAGSVRTSRLASHAARVGLRSVLIAAAVSPPALLASWLRAAVNSSGVRPYSSTATASRSTSSQCPGWPFTVRACASALRVPVLQATNRMDGALR
jgi:hypothetical protein